MDHLIPCTIGLGSNTPDRRERIEKAICHLNSFLSDCHVSEIYESPAYNGTDDPYLNAVIHGFTSLSYDETVKYLKEWEQSQGRISGHGGRVIIDLDIVIWDSHITRPKDFGRYYFSRGYRELLDHGVFQDILNP